MLHEFERDGLGPLIAVRLTDILFGDADRGEPPALRQRCQQRSTSVVVGHGHLRSVSTNLCPEGALRLRRDEDYNLVGTRLQGIRRGAGAVVSGDRRRDVALAQARHGVRE